MMRTTFFSPETSLTRASGATRLPGGGPRPARSAPSPACRPLQRSRRPSSSHRAPCAVAEIDSAAPSTRVETPSGQPASAAGLYTEPLAGSAASPPGARWSSPHRGCHFSLPSTSASAVSLVLFTPEDLAKGQTTAEIPLDPTAGNRTGDVWHVLVPSLAPGLLYAWRVTGADESLLVGERAGPYVDRSDPRAPVLDPWATAVASRARWGEAHPAPGAGRPGERVPPPRPHLAPARVSRPRPHRGARHRPRRRPRGSTPV